MNFELVLIYLAGYLIGTFPTALLLTRFAANKNILVEGTGNVGAHNAYDVTGKTWVGVATMLIDALKGAGVVMLAHIIYPHWFGAVAWASVGCVVGHNFNIFLRGKGGRGLATAMGACLLVNPALVVTWFVMFALGYFVIRKDVHVGSMTAILTTGVMVYSFPGDVFLKLTLLPFDAVEDVQVFAIAMLTPLFIRHLEPIRALVRQSMQEDSN